MGGLFRKRNILGAVLVAGIAAGVYLGDFWKGFGGGSTIGVGVGDPSSRSSAKSSEDEAAKSKSNSAANQTDDPKQAAQTLGEVPPMFKVVIDDRSYSIRSTDGDRPAEIPRIIEMIKAATGDADGIRIRIYKKLSSRTSAEIALQDALTAAGISEDHVLWIPTPVD